MQHMAELPFIITVDTEGDNMWSRPREITTRNAAYLPRFQALCERYGFKPVYLTDHEMALSDEFTEFARDVLARGAGEVGMHLHAWNSPPLVPLTDDDLFYQPYLIEYDGEVMREKIRRLTALLLERFGRPVTSHRAGRWAFDGRYAQMLLEEGYRVDCSVTPGFDWRDNPGLPGGHGGTDYSRFPSSAYFMDPADISRPADRGLLEVPMTIHRGALRDRAGWTYKVPLLRRLANLVSPSTAWLSPLQPALRAPLARNLDAMLGIAIDASGHQPSHLEFMVHSSELMPGGHPALATGEDIERLYEALEMLFESLMLRCRGMTLQEFHAASVQSAGPARAACAPGAVAAGA